MALTDIYNNLPKTPPKKAFIQELARVTHKSEHSARMWVGGKQTPDELTRATISKHLGISEKELFNI